MRRVPLAALLVPLVLVGAAGASPREPGPFRGAPLAGGTGLRLVVAAVPPFLLDVDTGTVTRIPGVPRRRGTVVPVGGSGAVVVSWSVPQSTIYGVRRSKVSFLGPGGSATAGGDGRSVWIKAGRRPSCSLRQVTLDGRRLRAPRSVRCAAWVMSGGSLGLVVNRTRVVDGAGRTVLKTRSGTVAAVGKLLLLDEPHTIGLTLLDTTTGRRRTFRLPSTIGSLGEAAVDPRGRFVALEFGNPSWTSEAGQAWDVWLLDVATAKLTHVPDLPAFVALKQTSMAWTDDGRLVFLAQSSEKDFVAVWRPGSDRLGIKLVRLPDRNSSGSDSFAPLP
jgi:hypothetical protein